MFEFFSDKARDVIVDAGYLAGHFGASHVGTEHLLVAAVRLAEREHRQPKAEGRDLHDLTTLEAALRARGTGNQNATHVTYSRRAKEVLEEARLRSRPTGVVRVSDIWRACLVRPGSGARALLAELGVRVDIHDRQSRGSNRPERELGSSGLTGEAGAGGAASM